MMPEKLANSATHLPVHGLTRRVGVLSAMAFMSMLMVLSLDHSTVSIVFDFWRYPTESLTPKLGNSPRFPLSTLNMAQFPQIHVQSKENTTMGSHLSSIQNVSRVESSVNWVLVELEKNYTSNLISRNLAPGGEPCKDSKTVQIEFLNFDDGKQVEFSTADSHEVVFRALDESGSVHCVGGDYFEINLAGELWKSRPPIKDFGNGTYSFILQVHPEFAGVYNVSIILLFRTFEGLKFSTSRFGYDKELRTIPVLFSKSESRLPALNSCKKSDLSRDIWVGRWTRHAKNDSCEISNDGRYRCLKPDFPCTNPWCNGSLASLESNGWVYSTHCSFRLFSGEDSWSCFNNQWLFFWGDSNHVDTIRNILFFFLGMPFKELDSVTRRFDTNFTNPKNKSQSVRITNIFNGHWNDTQNYQGLHSLSNEGHRELVKGFFNGSTVPDTVIFNSGLHDGIFWHSVKHFTQGANFAALFWKHIMEGVKMRGLKVPEFIFRSTISTGGYARTLSFNPSKMEAFNGVLLEKLRNVGLVTSVIDDFDMTWAWHFDNRCNDGVHYGRFPSTRKWRDGQIGHQYFVDLMLGHVLFNAICPVIV